MIVPEHNLGERQNGRLGPEPGRTDAFRDDFFPLGLSGRVNAWFPRPSDMERGAVIRNSVHRCRNRLRCIATLKPLSRRCVSRPNANHAVHPGTAPVDRAHMDRRPAHVSAQLSRYDVEVRGRLPACLDGPALKSVRTIPCRAGRKAQARNSAGVASPRRQSRPLTAGREGSR